MPRRHVLYLDATQLVAWGWRAGEVSLRGRFANDAEGHAQFAEFLRQRRDSLFLLLCDLVDEAFVAENVPFVRGGDRVSLLRRKLAQHFFGTPFTCAHSLGRRRSGILRCGRGEGGAAEQQGNQTSVTHVRRSLSMGHPALGGGVEQR